MTLKGVTDGNSAVDCPQGLSIMNRPWEKGDIHWQWKLQQVNDYGLDNFNCSLQITVKLEQCIVYHALWGRGGGLYIGFVCMECKGENYTLGEEGVGSIMHVRVPSLRELFFFYNILFMMLSSVRY